MKMKHTVLFLPGAIVLAAVAYFAPKASASPTETLQNDDDRATDANCALIKSQSPGDLFGRVLNIWQCGSLLHGQIASARAGDQVWFRDTPKLIGTVASGVTFANTPLPDRSLFAEICGRVADRGTVDCTHP